ncbi:HAD family hydrolase [Bacillus sp. DJP31]|uniref:HAD family hydrolase n=1 Tax=Bacillus sp. DJP31 TaxID=3409789 RepID=UPI003BB69934
MNRAVIFDLDGTLHDRDQSLYLFLQSQYDRLFANSSTFSMEQFLLDFIILDKNGHVWKDVVYEKLVTKYSIFKYTSEELLNDYIMNFQATCVVFNGTLEMLKELKEAGYKMGIITNGRLGFQRSIFHSLNLGPYFDDVIISEEVGLRKPDKEIFELSLQNLSVRANDAIYIGDHPFHDMLAAKNVGLHTIWKENSNWGVAKADAVYQDMKELSSLVSLLLVHKDKSDDVMG